MNCKHLQNVLFPATSPHSPYSLQSTLTCFCVSYGAKNLISSALTHTKSWQKNRAMKEADSKDLVMKFFAQSTLMRIMPAAEGKDNCQRPC